MIIELNPEATHKLRKFKIKCQPRKFKKADWIQIISQLLLNQNDEEWWRIINQFTHDERLISIAIENPELKRKFLSIIKHQPSKSTSIIHTHEKEI